VKNLKPDTVRTPCPAHARLKLSQPRDLVASISSRFQPNYLGAARSRLQKTVLFWLQAHAFGVPTLNTFLAFTGVLVGAAVVGWATFLLERKLKSRILRWALSGTVAALLLLLSWGFFVYRTIFLPAADNSIFNERSSYLVSIVGQGSSGEASLFSIEVVVPRAIKINEDIALDLSINAQTPAFQLARYQTSLKSGKEIQSRTLEPCGKPLETMNDATQVSCAKGTLGAPVRWFVRSDKTGSSYVTIQLPQEIKSELAEHAASWSAALSRNGELITKSVAGPERQPFSSYPMFTRAIPVVLSSAQPVYHGDEVEIDLRSLEITFPLRFETTLGVSASTYALLTNTGAILSALLGGGWLWHLLSWLKDKSGNVKHQVAGKRIFSVADRWFERRQTTPGGQALTFKRKIRIVLRNDTGKEIVVETPDWAADARDLAIQPSGHGLGAASKIRLEDKQSGGWKQDKWLQEADRLIVPPDHYFEVWVGLSHQYTYETLQRHAREGRIGTLVFLVTVEGREKEVRIPIT
jgi:hypothetical protein